MKIISGGQTGVDRAALDVAIELGVPYGGWVPRGGLAEDMPTSPGLLAVYPHLQEMPNRDYPARTERNVVESDGTLVVTPPDLKSRGTELTKRLALEHGRPSLVSDGTDADRVRRWLDRLHTDPGDFTMNVAGPRGSTWPEGYEVTRNLLLDVLIENDGLGHCPVPVNADGEGPLSDSDPDVARWDCLCSDPRCSWRKAFRWYDARVSGGGAS